MSDKVSVTSAGAKHGKPLRTNYCYQDVTGADGLLDRFGEVHPGSNIIHIHEYMSRAEGRLQPIADPTRISSRVLHAGS